MPRSTNMSTAKFSQRATARRADAKLRARYPHIATKLYEINNLRHEIFVNSEDSPNDNFVEHFNNSIVPITSNIKIVFEQPSNCELVSQIEDRELATDLEGMLVTTPDFAVALAGLFPDAPMLGGSNIRSDGTLEFHFQGQFSSELEAELNEFLTRHIAIRAVEVFQQTEPVSEGNQSRKNYGTSLSFRPLNARANLPRFISNEEEWWFDSLESLCSGTISPSDMTSPKPAGNACFYDGSFSGVNIRQLLLAFDTIYRNRSIATAVTSS